MAGNALPPSNIFLAVIAAFAMLLVAIIVQNFWLSLLLGAAGAVAFTYAVFLLREYRKGLSEDETDVP